MECARSWRSDGRGLGRVTVVLNRLPEHAMLAELRFIVQRTQEPLERWEAAMQLFQGTYFQQPRLFSDEVTALFSEDSMLAEAVLAASGVRLHFAQFSQRYELPCAVRRLDADDPLHAATWWHNALFNPVPDTCRARDRGVQARLGHSDRRALANLGRWRRASPTGGRRRRPTAPLPRARCEAASTCSWLAAATRV